MAGSNIRTVRSWLPLTVIGRPSRLPTATAVTLSVWPAKFADPVTGGQIPHPHRRIPAAADHDRAPVQLADGHRRNPTGVAGAGFADLVTGGQIPHPQRRIGAAANRYRLTGDGLRFAIFYTKVHDRLLHPLLAAGQPPAPQPLRNALHTRDIHITKTIDRARLLPNAA